MPSECHSNQTFDTDTDSACSVGNYVVCILDLLAQKEKLKAWAELPADELLSEPFREGMKKTIGTVRWFHTSFLEYFKAMRDQISVTPAHLAVMGADEGQQYQRQTSARLEVVQFSDTFVFYAPLGNDQGELLVEPLYAIITACCMAMQTSLAGRVPLRGGIHIGVGIKIPELSFYGPALAVAHHLEAEIAKYPRVVVSPSVVEFLEHVPLTTGWPRLDVWKREILTMTREFLLRDTDGEFIVDWFGKAFREVLTESGTSSNHLVGAHRFVEAAAKDFKQRADVKLAERYGRLFQYMLDRLPDWGINFANSDSGSDER